VIRRVRALARKTSIERVALNLNEVIRRSRRWYRVS